LSCCISVHYLNYAVKSFSVIERLKMTFEGFFKRLVMSNQLTIEDGRIEEFGVRMAFFPVFTLNRIVEMTYEKEGEEAFNLLFEAGKEHGHHIIQEVGGEHDVAKNRFMEETIESANVLGIGEIELEEFSPKGKIAVKVTDSPFVKGLKDSEVVGDLDRPVDDFVRGILQAMAEDIFDADATAEETMCEFQGDPYCRLVVKTEDYS